MATAPQEFRFPCTQCGADLRFNPGDDNLICDSCGAINEIDKTGLWTGDAMAELDFAKAVALQLPSEEIQELRVISCDSCGAQFELGPAEQATECPFCASPIVTDTGPQRRIKPKGLLPFRLEEKEARSAMTNWLGRLWFAPKGLQDYARKGRAMKGIYVPYWTYDADTKSIYSGQRGTIYYESRRVSVTVDGKRKTRTQKVQKIRWRRVKGRVARFFDDILVLGSTSLPKKYTDALAPWDLSELEPYQPEYLAGFRAEGYTVQLEDGFTEARALMNRMITRDVKYDIGGDRQRIDDLKTDVSDITFKHILLPVWLAAYKYRGKSYRFVVNGRTGQVQGERPYSAIKIAAAVILGLIIAGTIGYFVAQSR
jgi:DNA-directed RNA polymerase subunit RPC12/RpoP